MFLSADLELAPSIDVGIPLRLTDFAKEVVNDFVELDFTVGLLAEDTAVCLVKV